MFLSQKTLPTQLLLAKVPDLGATDENNLDKQELRVGVPLEEQEQVKTPEPFILRACSLEGELEALLESTETSGQEMSMAPGVQ